MRTESGSHKLVHVGINCDFLSCVLLDEYDWDMIEIFLLYKTSLVELR